MEEKNSKNLGENTAIKYRLAGQVQDVGFRYFLAEEAKRQDIAGWAKNERDGSLSVLLAGGQEVIDRMIPLLRSGPTNANVVNMTELALEDEDLNISSGFTVR